MQQDRASTFRHQILLPYGLAFLAVTAALLLRALFSPLFGSEYPYLTLWTAVVFAARFCGLGPSILATVFGGIGVWYWFLPPTHSFLLQAPKTQVAGMVGFLFFSALIIAFGEANRRSLNRSREVEQELQKAHDELEQKVHDRTAALEAANASLGELSSRLQQIRDEERRQIARELHDSVGQMLTALSMNLSVLQAQARNLDPPAARAVSESAHLVEQINRETRTISHLLHPPLLDVAGLVSALRWYADGFSERSKIKIEIDLPDDFPRLSDEMEIAIFRVVQECLTNIHRHSGASGASIRMREQDQVLQVEVHDNGRGIPMEKQLELSSPGRSGVGFRGMRERLRQLGGRLDIRSEGSGTTITGTLPLIESRSKADGQAEEIAS